MADTPAFQQAQNACFDTILKLYGQDCTWQKQGGDVVGTVLFNDPTRQDKFNVVAGRGLAHVGYENEDVTNPYIEYLKGAFEDLYEAVFNNVKNQYIVTGGKRFVCKAVTAFFDGQTYRVALAEAETDALIPEP